MKPVKRISLILSCTLLTSAIHLQSQTLTPAQQAYLKASNTGAQDLFGIQTAISGDTIVVAAPNEDSRAIGVNGNQSDNSATDSGAAYIFVRSGTNWVQQAYLKASNTDAGDGFGWSVAISGDTVVVGAPGEDSAATGINGDQTDNSLAQPGFDGAGAAYVFVRTGTNWSQQAYLKASNTGKGDNFGGGVAISGNTVVVAAPAESSAATGVNGNQNDDSAFDSGAAYVFVRDGTHWTQQAYLKASNTEGAAPPARPLGDEFGGGGLAISGDTIVVAAIFEDSNATGVNGDQSNNSSTDSGAGYVFVRSGTNWSQQAYLKASNTGAGDLLGVGASVSGDTIAVAAPGEDSSATGVNGSQTNNLAADSGAVYVFVRNGTNWSQQAYVKASNTGAADNFGEPTALEGDILVVGAEGEDSNATGINGIQSNNSASYSGAAYVFVRSGTNWSQQAYLKASNTGANDAFASAAVSGDTVVVGAIGESSNATGVNGNQSNNSAQSSGAAYVFTGFGAGTRLDLAPDGSGGYSIEFKGVSGLTYRLQRAPSVTGPWDTIATNTVPASGLIQHHETGPLPGTAFYRTVQP